MEKIEKTTENLRKIYSWNKIFIKLYSKWDQPISNVPSVEAIKRILPVWHIFDVDDVFGLYSFQYE